MILLIEGWLWFVYFDIGGSILVVSGPITGKVVGTTAVVGAVGPLSINNSRPADTWNPSQNTVESKHRASPCQRVF